MNFPQVVHTGREFLPFLSLVVTSSWSEAWENVIPWRRLQQDGALLLDYPTLWDLPPQHSPPQGPTDTCWPDTCSSSGLPASLSVPGVRTWWVQWHTIAIEPREGGSGAKARAKWSQVVSLQAVQWGAKAVVVDILTEYPLSFGNKFTTAGI